MEWYLGQPCAFNDQATVLPAGSPQPVYYELEAVTNLKTCQDFYQTEKGAKTTQAVDARYGKLAQAEILPNEYEIQQLSGVLAILNEMPAYAVYVKEEQRVKSALLYDLWGRPTL